MAALSTVAGIRRALLPRSKFVPTQILPHELGLRDVLVVLCTTLTRPPCCWRELGASRALGTGLADRGLAGCCSSLGSRSRRRRSALAHQEHARGRSRP